MTQICIYIKKRPDKSSKYIPHSYCWVDPKEAISLIDEGYAIEWDPEQQKEKAQLLPEDFPARYKLFAGGIYTPEQLSHIPEQFIVELDGIGEKTYDDIVNALEDF